MAKYAKCVDTVETDLRRQRATKIMKNYKRVVEAAVYAKLMARIVGVDDTHSRCRWVFNRDGTVHACISKHIATDWSDDKFIDAG